MVLVACLDGSVVCLGFDSSAKEDQRGLSRHQHQVVHPHAAWPTVLGLPQPHTLRTVWVNCGQVTLPVFSAPVVVSSRCFGSGSGRQAVPERSGSGRGTSGLCVVAHVNGLLRGLCLETGHQARAGWFALLPQDCALCTWGSRGREPIDCGTSHSVTPAAPPHCFFRFCAQAWQLQLDGFVYAPLKALSIPLSSTVAWRVPARPNQAAAVERMPASPRSSPGEALQGADSSDELSPLQTSLDARGVAAVIVATHAGSIYCIGHHIKSYREVPSCPPECDQAMRPEGSGGGPVAAGICNAGGRVKEQRELSRTWGAGAPDPGWQQRLSSASAAPQMCVEPVILWRHQLAVATGDCSDRALVGEGRARDADDVRITAAPAVVCLSPRALADGAHVSGRTAVPWREGTSQQQKRLVLHQDGVSQGLEVVGNTSKGAGSNQKAVAKVELVIAVACCSGRVSLLHVQFSASQPGALTPTVCQNLDFGGRVCSPADRGPATRSAASGSDVSAGRCCEGGGSCEGSAALQPPLSAQQGSLTATACMVAEGWLPGAAPVLSRVQSMNGASRLRIQAGL
jgi:hypothetical protein